ncbi:perlucin-like [Armigeres subalbatus]|uniref:perlucin-like n=1 Tax=Armigeres subalbatus TaxID=124917 RepID=UPI002ED51000
MWGCWIVFLVIVIGNVVQSTVFHISRVKKSWVSAIEYCKCYEMRLAVVDTLEKQKLLEQAIVGSPIFSKKYTTVWIGANDRETEGHFVWQPTGTAVQYSNWGPTAPNKRGRNKNCVHLVYSENRIFEWDDWRCQRESNVACEKIKDCD